MHEAEGPVWTLVVYCDPRQRVVVHCRLFVSSRWEVTDRARSDERTSEFDHQKSLTHAYSERQRAREARSALYALSVAFAIFGLLNTIDPRRS